jgi:hypothetical protein
MASNDNSRCKLEVEVEPSMTRKRLQLSDDDVGDDDSSNSEETSIKQLNTSEEKLFAKRGRGMIFSDNSNTTSPSSEPSTPESHRCSNKDRNDEDDDDDFWM